MARRPSFSVWLDLETSGSEPSHDLIFEVGAVVCRNEPDQPIVEEASWLVKWSGSVMTAFRSLASPVVERMHTVNGLWGDLESATDSITDIDGEASALLSSIAGSSHVALAGSGVSHFDRRFIRTQMPLTDARLTYWAYDVGVVRRMAEMVNPSIVRPSAVPKVHRALADAQDHRAEWVHYSEILAAVPL